MNIVYFMELSMKNSKNQQFYMQFQCTHYKNCGSQYVYNALHRRDRTLETEQYGASVHPVRQITQMHSPLFQLTCLYAGSKHLDFKIERKIYFTTSESLMFKLRLRLKFQETLSIKFTATKKPVIFILNNPPKTLNSPPKKLIKSSGYNEEICTQLIKPHVFFFTFSTKKFD